MPSFTSEQIALLGSRRFTVKELAQKLGVGEATICRARKKLGIKIPLGAEKGKPNPKKRRREIRQCKKEGCVNMFEVVPSRTKEYCSHSCHSTGLKFPDRIRPCKESTPAYKLYAGKVHRMSGKTYLENIDIINPNRYPRTVCGVPGGWQLDHVIPIKEGFRRNISPEKMSAVENLRMLPWKENLTRKS